MTEPTDGAVTGSTDSSGRIDRHLQRELLERMREAYPEGVNIFGNLPFGHVAMKLAANLTYLEQHGLCDAGIHWNMSGGFGTTYQKITARGIDFLEQDGGISAILGTVVVKLHADTLRDLIVDHIQKADLPAAEKRTLLKQVTNLSEAGLRMATTDLFQEGLHRIPDVATWLGKLLGL